MDEVDTELMAGAIRGACATETEGAMRDEWEIMGAWARDTEGVRRDEWETMGAWDRDTEGARRGAEATTGWDTRLEAKSPRLSLLSSAGAAITAEARRTQAT